MKSALFEIAFVLVIAGGLVWLAKFLWNALAPQLFGLPVVTYWQMFGLLVLTQLMFGGIHASGGRSK